MKEYFRRRISEVSGIDPNVCSIYEVERLVQLDLTRRTARDFPHNEFEFLASKYIAPDKADLPTNPQRLQRLYNERITRIQQYLEAVRNADHLYFFGQDAPSFVFGLQHLQRQGGLQSGSTSLLVGAITVDSLAQFIDTNKFVDPKAKTFCVDVRGEETRLPDTFVLGDCFHLPFKDNSLDTVQSHHLMDYIKRSKSMHGHSPHDYLNEVFRVLKPGGALLAIETSGIRPRHLRASGLETTFFEPATKFKTNADVYAFFEGAHDRIHDVTMTYDYNFILAQKPHRYPMLHKGVQK